MSFENIYNINDADYSIDPSNDGSISFFIYTGSSSKTITLADLSIYGDNLNYTFYNDSAYNLSIIPYSGQSIITGNVTLTSNSNCNLVSYSSNWYII
jgi:hypothetical protein